MKGQPTTLLLALLFCGAGCLLLRKAYTYWLDNEPVSHLNTNGSAAPATYLKSGPVDSLWFEMPTRPSHPDRGEKPVSQFRFHWVGCDTPGVFPVDGRGFNIAALAGLNGKTQFKNLSARVRYNPQLNGLEMFSLNADGQLILNRTEVEEAPSTRKGQIAYVFLGGALLALSLFLLWTLYRETRQRQQFLERFEWLSVKSEPLTPADFDTLDYLERKLRSEFRQWLFGIVGTAVLALVVPYRFLAGLKLQVTESAKGGLTAATLLGWPLFGALVVAGLALLFWEYRTARRLLLADRQRGVKIKADATVGEVFKASWRAPAELIFKPDNEPLLTHTQVLHRDYPHLKKGDRVTVEYLAYSGALLHIGTANG